MSNRETVLWLVVYGIAMLGAGACLGIGLAYQFDWMCG